MRVRVFGTRIGALALSLRIRVALGMPWTEGTDVGGGKHVAPGALARRTRFPRRLRRSGTQWAVPIDDDLAAALDAHTVTNPDGSTTVVPAMTGIAGHIAEGATWRLAVRDVLGNITQSGADDDRSDPE